MIRPLPRARLDECLRHFVDVDIATHEMYIQVAIANVDHGQPGNRDQIASWEADTRWYLTAFGRMTNDTATDTNSGRVLRQQRREHARVPQRCGLETSLG